MILPEGLLKEQISSIGIIPKDPLDAANVPVCQPEARGNAFPVQFVRYCLDSFPRKVHFIYAPHGLSLFRLDLIVVVFEAVAQQRVIVWDSCLKALLDAPLLILAGRQGQQF